MHTVDRTFQVRGKDIHLQELADLVAIRPDRPSRRTLSAGSLETLPSRSVLPQVRAFEAAGWRFVPRQQSADGARVYLMSGGQVALGTNRLTVHIEGNRSVEQARELLTRNGFRIVEQLMFGPNLFVVEVPDGDDAIDAAKRLSEIGEVKFAEPELIEMLSGRSR
jgi:hypothetical protein